VSGSLFTHLNPKNGIERIVAEDHYVSADSDLENPKNGIESNILTSAHLSSTSC